MIIVQLTGRLGNQMFQYAFAKALSLQYNTKCHVDLLEVTQYELDKVFSEDFIEAAHAQIEYCKKKEQFLNIHFRIFRRLCKRESKFHKKYWMIEKNFFFEEKNFRVNTDCLIQGFFQSEKYFKDYISDIHKIFTFKNPPNEYYTQIIEQVTKSNSVSVHFRRTDYLEDETIRKIHGPCDVSYYLKAIDVMRKRLDNPQFFLISDDIEWVKSYFPQSDDYVYVENNMGENYEDMRVMTLCKHNIIANSTFSWWGAWLNTHKEKIVVAPYRWFADEEMQKKTLDIIPDNWIQIKNIKLTVITPVYNSVQFIESCIQNVISQKCEEVEHLIIDGGSTDGTIEIIQKYAEQYPHIRLISEPDKGQSDAMNKGIENAKGEIISFLNADDLYSTFTLKRIISLFYQINPNLDFVVGNCKLLDAEGTLIYINRPSRIKSYHFLTRMFPAPINPAAYFYRKSIHNTLGKYTITNHFTMDYEFLIKASLQYNMVYFNEDWGNMIYHENSKTKIDYNNNVMLQKGLETFNAIYSELPFQIRLKTKIYAFMFTFRKMLHV